MDMKGLHAGIMAVLLGATLATAGCDDGPVERFGERVDRATGQDELIGKGPGEKGGEKIDDAVKELKR